MTASSAAPAQPAHHRPQPSVRVLLAEDDNELRSLLVAILRHDGCQVVEAASGNELLDRIADELIASDPPAFDVLVSDVRMPGRSGLSVVGGLRGSGFRTPVVLITAFGDADVHRRARELGVVLMDKPFDVDDFRAVVLEAALSERPTLLPS